jgi:hypothetical protein
MANENENIPWHPAFVAAMNLDFEEYKDVIQILSEFQLTTEPSRIDLLVVKKMKDAVIDKNIASVFKGHNLFEYKNPDDYLSIYDFYKVYGYACTYIPLNKVDITDLSISFVETRYPRDIIKHLREVRGYTVEEKWSGIYIVTGDIIPIQIIMSNKLSDEDNLWLKGLNKNLDLEIINKIILASKGRGDSYTKACWNAITRANDQLIEEVLKMGAPTLDEIFKRTGLTEKWIAEGKMEVLDLLRQGYTLDEIEAKLKQQ